MNYKRSSFKVKEENEKPFGPLLMEYRGSVCGTKPLVNEAIIDAGIVMAKFNNEYYEGYMPNVGCH